MIRSSTQQICKITFKFDQAGQVKKHRLPW